MERVTADSCRGSPARRRCWRLRAPPLRESSSSFRATVGGLAAGATNEPYLPRTQACPPPFLSPESCCLTVGQRTRRTISLELAQRLGSTVPDYDAISLVCNGSTRDEVASVFVRALLIQKARSCFATI